MIRSVKIERVILLFIVALAFALRMIWLSDANIWWDEGWTVLLMRESLFSIAQITSTDVHPPLYFWLLHVLWPFIGESELAVRFLSVAAGTLMVVVLWYLGRLLLPRSRWIPLAAAFLLATSRFGIWWSQEGRMYTVSGLFITLSLLFTVQVRWQPTRKAVVGYVLSSIAALYTLYILAFVLVVEGLYWLWTLVYEKSWPTRARLIVKWAILQLIVLAGFAPWLYYTLPRMKSWSAQVAFDAKLYFELYGTLLVLGIPTHIEQYRMPVLLVMGLIVLAFVLIRKEKAKKVSVTSNVTGTWQGLRWDKAGVSLLILALAIPPLVVWGVTMLPRSFGHAPKPAARYLFPYTPAFYLLVAWAMAALGAWVGRAQGVVKTLNGKSNTSRKEPPPPTPPPMLGEGSTLREKVSANAIPSSSLPSPSIGGGVGGGGRFPGVRLVPFAIKTALLITFFLLSLPGVMDYYQARYLPDDYKSLTLTMKAHHQANDVVLLHTDDPWPVFDYHWPDEWVGTPHLQEADAGGADYFLSPLWKEHEALWLVINEDALRVDPQRYFEQWLAERALAQHEWRFGTKRLLLFAKTEARTDALLALATDFVPPAAPNRLVDDGLTLVGWEQALHKVRAGDLLHAAAYVKQENRGGTVELWLADMPQERITIDLLPTNGLTRVPLTLPIAPEVSSQTTSLFVKLGNAERAIGQIELIGGEPIPPASDVSPQHPITATFGESPLIQLLGYDLDLPSHLNNNEGVLAPARLTVYWQTMSTPSLSYKVFTHLVNREGQVIAQRDDYPVQGNRPTTSWRKGELIVDRYEIPLTEAPQGSYTLIIGFYDATTGIRLNPVKNATEEIQANDQMLLGTVEIPALENEQ